jgi:alkylhydroperoxidase family enzyme
LPLPVPARDLKKAGETDERLFAVAAWRDAPYFTDAERAALALTDESVLAALIIAIANINVWNRLNVTPRQVAGSAWSAERPAKPPAPQTASR